MTRNKAFTKLAAVIALEASCEDVDRAMQLVMKMQQAFIEGDDDRVADCLGDLAELAPGGRDALKQAFTTSPLRESVGPASRYVLRRMA